jgi:hypothetical protein
MEGKKIEIQSSHLAEADNFPLSTKVQNLFKEATTKESEGTSTLDLIIISEGLAGLEPADLLTVAQRFGQVLGNDVANKYIWAEMNQMMEKTASQEERDSHDKKINADAELVLAVDEAYKTKTESEVPEDISLEYKEAFNRYKENMEKNSEADEILDSLSS